MVHPVAYQLIVTHRGTGPDPGSIRQMSGNSAIRGSTAKKRANAIDLGPGEIWLAQSLVNGAKLSRISSF
jgi:hypothetical protein